MNEMLIFGFYELIKFIVLCVFSLFVTNKSGLFDIGTFITLAGVLVVQALVGFIIKLMAFDLLVWIAAQFNIIAASNLVYIVIIIVLDVVISSIKR